MAVPPGSPGWPADSRRVPGRARGSPAPGQAGGVSVSTTGGLRRAARAALSDITPLRESPPFRRLFTGLAVSAIGSQVTQAAVPLQVYAITRSSLDVGLIGLAALLPLVVFGLYGGAIADAVDRRKLIFLTSLGAMLVSVVLLVQSVLHVDNVALLFGCVGLQSAFAAVNSPTRGAIVPQLVGRRRLAAANTLVYGSVQLAVVVGPLLAGVAIASSGFGAAYAIDVATFSASLYAAIRLPALPPTTSPGPAGVRSVVEGLRFLAVRPIVLMTFLVDIDAMLFSMPRALFPAMARQFGGGAHAAGLLYAATGIGAMVAMGVGGAIARVRHQGRGITIAISVWALGIVALGLSPSLWWAVAALVIAGFADTVSAVYRSTMLQAATPTSMQGRLQGVYTVVVNGGARLGDLRAGAMGNALSTETALVGGGIACFVGLVLLVLRVPAFWRYDARDVRPPEPPVVVAATTTPAPPGP